MQVTKYCFPYFIDRGIYSNVLGFLGGISLAIMMARICQLYPNAVSSKLVHMFFLFYSNWEWPIAVHLQHYKSVHMRYPVWDPQKNPADKKHLMPIITPSYPQQNSTYNVSKSTSKIIQKELQYAATVSQHILRGKTAWTSMFQQASFFSL